ncbi:Uncharacterised protein [Amycolatopsis camponoti]|uniref:Uncharacterized protein n=1 Tax=Amycolatopsis camponoti TaxID=2606593 RepID=A0A6I8LZW1_9PSEU|nr:hypothetical protein [Amycolatopsis camponoti]VVJ20856.1 Uncharacterised protein [Amycolatopsis camponoti]
MALLGREVDVAGGRARHLTNADRTLGIDGRRKLAGALASSGEADVDRKSGINRRRQLATTGEEG